MNEETRDPDSVAEDPAVLGEEGDDEIVVEASHDPTDPPASGEAYSTFRVMHLESVLYDLTDTSPLVHLMEAESPYRYLAIPIALSDAIALHHAQGSISARRPSTGELMTTILTRLQAEVIAARIVRYEEGVFYSELDLMTPKGREVFDCRTSDALILAKRQRVHAPILCAEEVLSLYFA
ncbi:MAG TPA: bifunctional nuclease family protein [Acidimicrobiales bacterium]